MSNQLTSKGLLNATSLPESADGPTPCVLPDGQTKPPFGQGAAPASLSVSPERVSDMPTKDTCGLPSLDSLTSAILQQSLANKLRVNLEGRGGETYKLTWKEWDMQEQPPICALRASRPRISDKDFTGLPTPSGCSNHGKNNVMGRLDEWGGSSNPWRGTEIGKVRCASFEAWMMGYPMEWLSPTVFETLSFRKLHKHSSK